MLADLRSLDSNQTFDTPICIIGAGIAGLTLARRLLALGWPVLLVESGGKDCEMPVQRLSAGTQIGHPYYDLDSVSLRMLGGTTAIWGGRCAELDPVDFETRAWVPHSGWPFGLAKLRPYYDQALKIFQVPAPAADRRSMADRLPLLQSLDRDDLAVGFWSFDDVADRFAAPRIGDVLDHPRCRVLIHATVTALHLAPGASFVSSATMYPSGDGRSRLACRHRLTLPALASVQAPWFAPMPRAERWGRFTF